MWVPLNLPAGAGPLLAMTPVLISALTMLPWPIGLLLTTRTLNWNGYLRRETLLNSSDI